MTEQELKHFGIQGMKWGVRRYENLDGTLTPEGKERYRKAWKATARAGMAVALSEAAVTGYSIVKNRLDFDTVSLLNNASLIAQGAMLAHAYYDYKLVKDAAGGENIFNDWFFGTKKLKNIRKENKLTAKDKFINTK